MAIEKLNRAASEAQPKLINMAQPFRNGPTLPRLGTPRFFQVLVLATMAPSPLQQQQRIRQPYPSFKVVVLDDDVNTFQHVVECLQRYIPAMQPDRAWELAHQIDSQGAAVVWCGPQEQAELYHQQLGAEGLTMAPLEKG